MGGNAVNCAVIRYDSALSDLWKKKQAGTVAGIYQQCFHVLLDDGRIITVFGRGQQTMPMSIYTDAEGERPFWTVPLEEGHRVFFFEKCFQIPEADFFCMIGGVEVNLQRKPLPTPCSSDLLRDALRQYGKENGEGRWLQSWCEYVLHNEVLPEQATLLRRIDTLIKTVASGANNVWDGLMDTVGMGCGLTPSTDDIICGLAASAWLFWPESRKRCFLNALTRFCSGRGTERTTRISCQQLELTARGILSDPVYRLAEALSLGQRNAVYAGTAEVICYGSSSGTELCMGFLAGVHMAVEYGESEENRDG